MSTLYEMEAQRTTSDNRPNIPVHRWYTRSAVLADLFKEVELDNHAMVVRELAKGEQRKPVLMEIINDIQEGLDKVRRKRGMI